MIETSGTTLEFDGVYSDDDGNRVVRKTLIDRYSIVGVIDAEDGCVLVFDWKNRLYFSVDNSYSAVKEMITHAV